MVRGCLMLAVQADGCEVVTIEGITETEEIADLQANFVERNASITNVTQSLLRVLLQTPL